MCVKAEGVAVRGSLRAHASRFLSLILLLLFHLNSGNDKTSAPAAVLLWSVAQ